MTALKIGEVAQRSDVGVETIRYYERQGLLAEPERRPSGYRQYDESVIARLQFIRRGKELGFTLNEIKELLGLWFDDNARCEHVRNRATQKLEDIEQKIRALQKIKRSLKQVVRECESRGSFTECPLWEGLDDGSRRNRGSAIRKR